MKNPLNKLLFLRILSSALFIVPVAVAFYQTRGASYGEFLMLQACLRIATICLELPTGYIADKWERKRIFLLVYVAWMIGSLVILFAYGFWTLLAAQIFFALSNALVSGTTTSYLYDYLESKDETGKAVLWEGRLGAAGFISEAISGLAGAWLFTLNENLPIIAMVLTSIIGISIAASLPTTDRIKSIIHKPLYEMFRIVRFALYEHRELKWLITLPALCIGCTGVIFWSIQPRMAAIGMDTFNIGAGIALYMLLKGCFSLAVGQMVSKLNALKIITATLLSLLAGGCLLLYGANAAMIFLGGFMAAGITHAVGGPIFTTLINSKTDTTQRATIQSLSNLIQTIWSAGAMIFVPFLMNYYTLETSIICMISITLALSFIPLTKLVKLGTLKI